MKSFKEAHPDFGLASGPVDVQRYVEGREQALTAADFAETVSVGTVFEAPTPALYRKGREKLTLLTLIMQVCLSSNKR